MVGVASVLLLSAVAWPPTWHPLADSALTLDPEPTLASLPPSAVVTEAPKAAPVSSAVESPVATALPVAALSNPPQASDLPLVSAAPAKAPRRSVKKVQTQAAKPPALVKTVAATAGPRDLCAGRNVFTRPYCVQRRCEEPRFRAHPQCVQLRHEAQERYRRE
jgi:hypothetical protein